MKTSKLKNWRKANDLTLIEAAKHFGCSIGYLSELERGLKTPSLQMAYLIKNKTEGTVTPDDYSVEPNRAA